MLRRLFTSLVVLHLAVLGLATASQAVGFRIEAHGAKAMGMNGAFAAQADDPSAIYYNPAGITQLEGTQVQFGITFIHATGSDFEPFAGQATLLPGGIPATATGTDIPGKTFSLPTFFITKKVSDRTSIGFGTYTPFGLQLDWPDDWTGRNLSTFDEIKSNYFDFVVAHDVLPWWSVSAGLAYVRSEVKLSRTSFGVLPAPAEAVFDIEAQGWTWTYDLGTQVRLGDRVKVGAAYRHQAVVEYNGDFNGFTPTGVQFIGTDATTKIPLPSTLAVGIAIKPVDWWTVEFDWDYTHWSSFKDLSLDLNTAPDPATLGLIEAGLAAGSPSPNRRWKNSSTFRVGTQFQVSEPLALRLGYAYINTPIPAETIDPILPDADRSTFAAGFGYQITKAWTFDFAYEYQYFHERAKNNAFLLTSPPGFDGLKANGTYNTDAHVFVTQLKYVF